LKLPFKIPKFKLPKFGKKKADDDEDDDEFDFDPSDFEGDPNASLGDAPESPAGEDSDEDELDLDADPDAGTGDEETPPATVSPADEAPPALEEETGGDEGDGLGETGEATGASVDGPGDEFDIDDDFEDIDFGDDDEDEDDESKAGGLSKLKKKIAGASKKQKIIFGGGAGTTLLLLIGGLTWFFMSGSSEEQKAAEEISNIPKVALDIAPKRKVGGGNSLNAIAKGAVGPGAGVVVPVVSPAVFASLAPPAITEAPLGDGNDPALIEQSPQGPLPKIAESGRMAWQAYAKPFENQDARPRIAIVVSGLGQSQAATDAAIRLLPGNVTLAFDPYSPDLLDWAEKARQAGHEIMIMMPLEPSTFPTDDPGPQGLMTTNAVEENRLRLEYVLSRMTGYIGVMSVMGSKFNTSDEHVRAFLEEIQNRGLMFLEGTTNQDSLAPTVATEIGLPRALTNLIVDSIPTKDAIDGQLTELEGILGSQPATVAIAEAYPSSIERLAVWTASLESKNFVLAPLSAMADKQFLQ
jgi:uncharacterized protein